MSPLGWLATSFDPDLGCSRIEGVRVCDGGVRPYWLRDGEHYDLDHDGMNWLVSGGGLGGVPLTCLGTPVRGLLVDGGEMPLARLRGYRVVQEGDRWRLLSRP